MLRWRKATLIRGLALCLSGSLLTSSLWAEDDLISESSESSDEATKLLKNPKYRFCQDTRYRLLRAQKEILCKDLSVFEERCPALPYACARPAWEESIKPEPNLSWFSWLENLPWSFLGTLLRGLFWAGLALGAFLALRALLKRFSDVLRSASKTALTSLTDASTPEVMKHESEEWLKMAEQALTEGKLALSLNFTYFALVRALGDTRRLRIHRSFTTGDYVASLQSPASSLPQGKAPIASAPSSEIATCLTAIDTERFGHKTDKTRTQRLFDAAQKMLARGSSLLLLGLGLLGCDDYSTPENPGAPHGPDGSALYESLLTSRADSLKRRVYHVTELPPETNTVISMGANLKEREWKVVRNFVHSGGRLVITEPDAVFASVFEVKVSRKRCTSPLSAAPLSLSSLGAVEAFVASPGTRVLTHCGNAAFAAEAILGKGRIVFVSDSSFFRNASLAAQDHATLAMKLSGDFLGHVEYLSPLTGSGSRTPIESILHSGFQWWVLHLLLFLGLFALSQGRHFGRPVDPPEKKRRAFADHALALSHKYQESRSSGWALQNYAEWAVETLQKRGTSSKSDLRSLSRSLSKSPKEATLLFSVLSTARKADELGAGTEAHLKQFEQLKLAISRGLSVHPKKKQGSTSGT